jgi:hypothetical protein
MAKYTLIQEDDHHPKTIIRHEVEGVITLTDLIENFEIFLKASGYTFDGYLDIVTDQESLEFEDKPEHEVGWYNTPDEPGITRIGISEK